MFNAQRPIDIMWRYNFTAVASKDTIIRHKGKEVSAVRITADRVFTETELESLKDNKYVIAHDVDGSPLVTHHKYAPEIQYSYLYVIC